MKKNLNPYDLPTVHRSMREQTIKPLVRRAKPYDLTSLPKLSKKDLDIMRKQW